MALKLPEWDQVLCYESTTLSNRPDLTTGARVKGVQLVQFSARLRSYDGERIAWRRIEGTRSEEKMQTAADFMREFQGVPYEKKQIELLRSALDRFILSQNQPDASSVFCCEMVALLHRRVGIMQPPSLPANELTPKNFSGELSFSEGYQAGDLITINP